MTELKNPHFWSRHDYAIFEGEFISLENSFRTQETRTKVKTLTRCLQKAACRSNASFPMLWLPTLNLAFSIWQYFLRIYEVPYVFCLKFLRSLLLNLYPSSWCLAGDKHVAPPDLLWFANAYTGGAKKGMCCIGSWKGIAFNILYKLEALTFKGDWK